MPQAEMLLRLGQLLERDTRPSELMITGGGSRPSMP
jgi:hypothetical protein